MSKKGRSASMGVYSGANKPDIQKRVSYKAFGKSTGTTRTLTFYGLARGKEYTPMTGGAGRIMIVHGMARLVVDDEVRFELAYVTARFKALRFARQLKLETFYEFTDFLYETWEPKVITPAPQEKLHSFLFADYNVTPDKYKELAGDGPFNRNPRLIFSSVQEIHSFFEGADPAQFGKEKPVLCCRFKTVSATGDSMVGNGLIRSAWRVSDAHDSIAYSAIGESRGQFSLVVGKEYKAYGFSIYYNGNSPPTLQPTMWGHLEECSSDGVLDDVMTIENEDQVEKFFIFTMIKFTAVAMTCPAHDCQTLVDAATLSALLVCPRCGASFRLDSKKLQIKMILNGTETAPMIDKDGDASTMQGPSIENFRIAEYNLVQKLFDIDRPEKLMSKSKKLHEASAEAMSRLFKVTYHRESLVISKLEVSDEKVGELYDADAEDSSDGESGESSPKKRKVVEEKTRKAGGKKKRKTKAKAMKRKRRKHTKKGRRRSSSSDDSSLERSADTSSEESSDQSSTASVKTRSEKRFGEAKTVKKKTAELRKKQEDEAKQRREEEKRRQELATSGDGSKEKDKEDTLSLEDKEEKEKREENEKKLKEAKELEEAQAAKEAEKKLKETKELEESKAAKAAKLKELEKETPEEKRRRLEAEKQKEMENECLRNRLNNM